MSRILSLDFGDRRIGVALTDETKTISLPQPYIFNQEKEKIIALVKDKDVEQILLGLPIGLSGRDTAATEKVRKFAVWLEGATRVPVLLIDERLTTSEVRRFETNKELIDSLVAQKMLERYIENSK